MGIFQNKQTTGILLRNWLTYLLRENISEKERLCYHTSKKPDLEKAKQKLNVVVITEIEIKIIQHKNENSLAFFDKIMTHAEILCKKSENEEYEIRTVFA